MYIEFERTYVLFFLQKDNFVTLWFSTGLLWFCLLHLNLNVNWSERPEPGHGFLTIFAKQTGIDEVFYKRDICPFQDFLSRELWKEVVESYVTIFEDPRKRWEIEISIWLSACWLIAIPTTIIVTMNQHLSFRCGGVLWSWILKSPLLQTW